MTRQHMTPQQPKPKRKYATWVYWTIFAMTLAVTLALIGLVVWLYSTQKIDQLNTAIGILAGIATLVSIPFIFFFTVFKKPEPDKDKPDGVSPRFYPKPGVGLGESPQPLRCIPTP